MATVSNNLYPNYTNLSSIKSYWIDAIAPNYFDFENVNNYNIGIFGYINEVMGNTTEDAFNSVAITRREFYPVTAQFISSLYAMATLQSIDIPLTTPSTCRCILIIPQDDIINNSEFTNGVYECTIDDCLKIFAGDLQFMLDYPIKIISKRRDQWAHTVHYDIKIDNSLNNSNPPRYLSTKVIRENGVNYVALFVDCIRQVQMEEKSQIVVKDTILDTVTMDIDFDGNLANFEVFYKENANSEEMQLTKIMINAAAPQTPYVQYELINQNKIRLTFSYNTIFTPKFNSEIITKIYTSEGSNGNFNQYTEDIVCSSNSTKYPYNTNMTILGRINGSATGGADQPLTDEFRNKVVMAYATNKTIATENDLQYYFDDRADDINGVKILFKKKRDDVFIRLYGAYSVYKDEGENVIPTNTLEVEIRKNELVSDVSQSVTKMTVPAGSVFKYKNASSYVAIPVLTSTGRLKTLLDVLRDDPSDTSMYFTNPFMISINSNNCGYYMTSLAQTIPIEYVYINDNSFQQFIGGSFEVYRNALAGNNFYRFRIRLTPTADASEEFFVTENDESAEENQIRAVSSGMVTKEEYYYDENISCGYIRYVIEYENGNIAYIRGSNTSPIYADSITGYKMKFNVGEVFNQGDILAVKRYDDLGNLVIAADIGESLYSNGYYIPMTIQDVDSSTGSFILEGYIATKDEIDNSEKIAFNHGIFDQYGDEVDSVALNMRFQTFQMSVLYNDDSSTINTRFSNFTKLNAFTHTNNYTTGDDYSFNFITSLGFIRSNINFYPIDSTNPSDNTNYLMVIDEVPFLGARWASDRDQFDYFIQQYTNVNDVLNDAYLSLHNTFSIDSKFYNILYGW